MKLKYKDLLLRNVTLNDEKLLFDWANDPIVRQGSFNENTIPFDEHQIWFRNKLSSQNTFLWILECTGIPCGVVRTEKSDRELTLNYLIASSHRGKGLASIMLEMALEKACIELSVDKIFAYTLPDNIASCKSLLRAGFKLETAVKEKKCFVYYCT